MRVYVGIGQEGRSDGGGCVQRKCREAKMSGSERNGSERQFVSTVVVLLLLLRRGNMQSEGCGRPP